MSGITEPKTLDEYRAMCTVNVCKWCGCRLSLEVLHYPHEGGWRVKGMEGRHWLYVHCIRCDYDHVLWKLGVPRWIGDALEHLYDDSVPLQPEVRHKA